MGYRFDILGDWAVEPMKERQELICFMLTNFPDFVKRDRIAGIDFGL